MNDYRIEVLQAEEWVLDAYGIGGRVFMELPAGFEVRMSKPLVEISEGENIGRPVALPVSLPYGPVNDALMSGIRVTTSYPPKEIRIKVAVLAGGSVLDIDEAVVIGASDPERSYSVELIVRGWADFFERTALAELNLGTFTWTKANIQNQWRWNVIFLPVPTAVPALVDYGAWGTPGDVKPADLRLWMNAAHLLRTAFCAAGFELRSGFLDTFADLLFCYVSPERWHWYPGKTDVNRTNAGITSPVTITTAMQLAAIGLDLVSGAALLDPVTNEYVYNFSGDAQLYMHIKVQNLRVRLPAQTPRGTLTVFFQFRGGGPAPAFTRFRQFRGSETRDTEVVLNFEETDFEARPNRRYGLFMLYEDIEAGTLNQYEFQILGGGVLFMPDVFRYTIGDEVPLADVIDPAISCMDLLKGVAHLCKAKFSIQDKVVYMHPPNSVRVASRNVQGFFQNSAPEVEVTEWVEAGSMEVSDDQVEANRYIEFGFQAADEYAKSIGRENPFANTVDLERGKIDTTKEANPFFAPTLERQVPGAEVGGAGVRIPAAWDNTDGRSSRRIVPRIGAYQGEVTQAGASWMWDGASRTNIPYLSQWAGPITGGIRPNIFLGYGSHREDFVEAYWRRDLSGVQRERRYSFLLRLTVQEYYEFGFMQRFGINYAGQYRVFRLLEISDFSPLDGLATPCTFREIYC